MVYRIGMTAVDTDKTAVPTHDRVPAGASGELLGAVVLAAAVGNIRIGRMQRDASELSDLQIAVDIRPLKFAWIRIIQAPDAAVVPVQELAVGVEVKGVNIGMSVAGNPGPCIAAVSALDKTGGATIRRATGVDDIGIGRINGQRDVVPA